MAKSKSTPTKTITPPDNGHTNVSIRKISNGYVISQSSIGARGNYKSVETFSKTPPKLMVKK